MSKHHNHNYTNYSKPQTAPAVEPEVKEEVVDTVEPEVTEIIGVVTECVKLNVRKEPDVSSDVVTTLFLGTEVMINETESTDEFYKICTAAGVEGFCMKKFINTNS